MMAASSFQGSRPPKFPPPTAFGGLGDSPSYGGLKFKGVLREWGKVLKLGMVLPEADGQP